MDGENDKHIANTVMNLRQKIHILIKMGVELVGVDVYVVNVLE
jgi:hypothetical protein